MKITLIAGSNRANATSTQLLHYIASHLQDLNITVNLIDLSELPLPLFTPDNWDFAPNVRQMLDAIADCSGLILATPEYHGSISGTLKNALDYVTGGQMAGKVVLSVSSAGGPLGVSSLLHLQAIVRNIHGINCPEWISLGYGANALDSAGVPQDEGMKTRVHDTVTAFVELARTIAAASVTAG